MDAGKRYVEHLRLFLVAVETDEGSEFECVDEKAQKSSFWEMVMVLAADECDQIGWDFGSVDVDVSADGRCDPNQGLHFPLFRKEHLVPPQAIV